MSSPWTCTRSSSTTHPNKSETTYQSPTRCLSSFWRSMMVMFGRRWLRSIREIRSYWASWKMMPSAVRMPAVTVETPCRSPTR